MINLSNWLDSRGTFKDVAFGEVELQIVSLSKDLIEQLKALPTHAMMIDFAAEHGLAHNRTRISDDSSMCEDLPIIWALPEFAAAKGEIVDAIAELSDVTGYLVETLEAEELEAIEEKKREKNLIKQQLEDNPHIDIHLMAEDNAIDNQLNP